MVGKAKSIAHTSNAVDYAKDKLHAEEILRHNVIGNTGLEIENQFKVYQNLNSNTKLNTISVVLSPEPEDGRKLTNDEFREITQNYLDKMNLKEYQHIAYVHKDRDHAHIHLYVNRINDKGKAYNDSFIGKRTQQKAHEIAKDKGLISAREKMIQNINREKLNLKELKNEIFRKHQSVMMQKPKSFDNYIKQMNLQGLEVKPTINRQGQIQGFRVTDLRTNNNFKMSEVNRSMSVGNLIKNGLKNDLDNQLNKTLKTSQNKQNLAIDIKKTIARESNNLIKNKDAKMILGKEKLTKKEYLDYRKFEEDVIQPHYVVEHQKYWNEERPKEIDNENNRNINKDNER
ncbi:relaxase/mobilization nuclease domain-containing protein [Flavobacterium sp. J27]|uniref:relaxase/mobilization nuclease domain-containing protein n=1 Tax=Flavobacterium sp. J27 TaxID=2060419 RepID=UPI001031A9B1|nr:relaxase/mobilization nuclease domain-containing protein [Flavobacterium sp. J27]